MNARRKLNAANINGIVVVAIGIGLLSGSAAIAAGVAATLLCSAIVSGQLRSRPTSKQRPR